MQSIPVYGPLRRTAIYHHFSLWTGERASETASVAPTLREAAFTRRILESVEPINATYRTGRTGSYARHAPDICRAGGPLLCTVVVMIIEREDPNGCIINPSDIGLNIHFRPSFLTLSSLVDSVAVTLGPDKREELGEKGRPVP